MRDADWWSLPGPKHFVGRLVADAMDGGVAFATCPRPLPDGITEAIRRQLVDDMALDVVIFDASRVELGVSLLHELALAHGVGGSSIGTVVDFLSDPVLSGVAFLIDGIGREALRDWGVLVRSLLAERAAVSSTGGPYLLAFMPEGLSGDDVLRLKGRARERPARGMASAVDSHGWISALGLRVGSGLDERVAVATVVEVAAWSRPLLETCMAWDMDDQLAPIDALYELASSRTWDAPRWENGLLDVWDDVPTPHAAAAVAHGRRDEVERRVWAAQSRVLTPVFDAARRGVIAANINRLSALVSRSQPYQSPYAGRVVTITDPRNLELRDVFALIQNRMSKDDLDLVRSYRLARNDLSHARPLDLRTLKIVFEIWDRAVERFAGGWSFEVHPT